MATLPPNPRRTALVFVAIAAVASVATWIGLSRAADVGIDRLARIDRVRAVCDSGWRTATRMADTMRVDRVALADTIDRGTSGELSRCADLRPSLAPRAKVNAREMRPDIPSQRGQQPPRTPDR